MKKFLLLIIIILALLGGGYYWFSQNTDVEFEETEVKTIPTRIEKIKEIGEWEFLTISDEEIAEYSKTVKRTWPLPDAKQSISRIYSGTLRVGFNLKKDVKEGWIVENGDTVDVRLPKVHLLDERFIDEAASRSLIEEGDFSHEEREKLYDIAQKKMKAACLTPENMQRAETTAKEQMTSLLKAIGFKVINVDIEK